MSQLVTWVWELLPCDVPSSLCDATSGSQPSHVEPRRALRVLIAVTKVNKVEAMLSPKLMARIRH